MRISAKWKKTCLSNKLLYFVTLDSATLPEEQRTKAELFLSIHTMTKY